MRVMVLGLRGFPDVQGGVESHSEHLYPLLAARGCDVEVIVRSPHVSSAAAARPWKGVRFRRLWSPSSKGVEALVHSVLGVLYAGIVRPDVLHVHAIGPAIVVPLARILGLKVVVTHHGSDYEREKWGSLARWILRLGERWGMRYSNERIVISRVIQESVQRMYAVDSRFIPNGVDPVESPTGSEALVELGLEPHRYILQVSRLVPEKRQLDLIEAYSRAELQGWKLVLVGKSDHPDAYSQRVGEMAAATPGVVLAGFRIGEPLRQLFANAGIFVLPSSHEGLPIALLEALSYGLPALASDIPANREVGLPDGQYFSLGNTDQLAAKLRVAAAAPPTVDQRKELSAWVAQRYNWAAIADAVLEVYQSVVASSKGATQ